MRAPIATVTVVFSALAAMFVACTFPSPALIDDDAATRSDAIGRSDSDVPHDGPADAYASDVLVSDAFYESDSPYIFVEAGDAEGGLITYNCDKDGDRVFATGAPCGGLDCNDDNPEILPASNMPFITKPPPAASAGDWNCDGQVERQHLVNRGCGLPNNLQCEDLGGFTGDPACGTQGDYITGCTKNGLGLCVIRQTVKQTQGCR